MNSECLNHTGKRPNNSVNQLKIELVKFIKEESKKDHFPSRRELQHKFHFGINGLGCGIKELYKMAQVEYKLAPNQEEKIKKATIFLELILKELPKFELNLIIYRNAIKRSIDIIGTDGDKTIGIELKAYNSGEAVKMEDILPETR